MFIYKKITWLKQFCCDFVLNFFRIFPTTDFKIPAVPLYSRNLQTNT